MRYYKIAGVRIAMDTYGRTAKQAVPYEIEKPEQIDFTVESFWKNVRQDYPEYSDDDGEYLATGHRFYNQLLDYDGFRFHSSVVVVDGRAYLFSADSGTGKSTHTQLWLKKFGDRAYILNDDKPALRLENGTWYAYGTPWSGKYDISVNTRVPVAGIAMLERADENEIEPFGGPEAIRKILAQSNRVRNPQHTLMLMKLLDQLITQVPVWRLRCNMDPEAAEVSYRAMSGATGKENESC